MAKQISVEQVESQIRKNYEEYLDKLDLPNKIAIWITNHVGSVYFFLIICLWTVFWLAWNMLTPRLFQFDPAPDFLLWLFISNVIQLLLMPLVLLGQNIQSKQTEFMGEYTLRCDLQSENNTTKMLSQLRRMEAKLDNLQKK